MGPVSVTDAVADRLTAAARPDADETGVGPPPGPFWGHDLPGMLIARGQAAMDRRDWATAVHLFALAGGHTAGPAEPAARLMNRAMRQLVPRWHFAMLNDDDRNQAYRKAVHAAIRPGDVVLDIGTGAGLLSLFAAEAGAELVVTCDVEPLVAAVARQVVADNGLSTRIKVVAASSTELRVGVDLPRRADVLVTEIFDCGLLGEGALTAFEHARRELLREDAALVPGAARLWGQLVESEELYARNEVSEVCGYDLSAFSELRSMEYFSTYLQTYPHRVLGEPFPILDVDFRTAAGPAHRQLSVPIEAGGTCHAVVMWFELDLGPGITLSNGPQDRGTHWRQAVQTFHRPFSCELGDAVAFTAVHDGERVMLLEAHRTDG